MSRLSSTTRMRSGADRRGTGCCGAAPPCGKAGNHARLSITCGASAWVPAIERALPVLRELVAILARGKDPFRLTVTWTASDNAETYDVRRSVNDGAFSTIAGDLTTTSYVDEDVAAGEQGDDQALEQLVLADDDLLDLVQHALHRRPGGLVHWCNPQ